MQIASAQIDYRKKIGLLDGSPVYELATKGGLHLIAVARDGKAETLGAGPHRAVARHIAKKREPTIVYTELSKSDWIEPEDFEHLLPSYEGMTDELRKKGGF